MSEDLLTFTDVEPTHVNFLGSILMNITNIRNKANSGESTPTSALAGLTNILNAFNVCVRSPLYHENPVVHVYWEQLHAKQGSGYDLAKNVGIGAEHIVAISDSPEHAQTFKDTALEIANGIVSLIQEHISSKGLLAEERKTVNAHLLAHAAGHNCGGCASTICKRDDDAVPAPDPTVFEIQQQAGQAFGFVGATV